MKTLNVKPEFYYYFGLFLVKKSGVDDGAIQSIKFNNFNKFKKRAYLFNKNSCSKAARVRESLFLAESGQQA
jgi:hypothetical protein